MNRSKEILRNAWFSLGKSVSMNDHLLQFIVFLISLRRFGAYMPKWDASEQNKFKRYNIVRSKSYAKSCLSSVNSKYNKNNIHLLCCAPFCEFLFFIRRQIEKSVDVLRREKADENGCVYHVCWRLWIGFSQ